MRLSASMCHVSAPQISPLSFFFYSFFSSFLSSTHWAELNCMEERKGRSPAAISKESASSSPPLWLIRLPFPTPFSSNVPTQQFSSLHITYIVIYQQPHFSQADQSRTPTGLNADGSDTSCRQRISGGVSLCLRLAVRASAALQWPLHVSHCDAASIVKNDGFDDFSWCFCFFLKLLFFSTAAKQTNSGRGGLKKIFNHIHIGT